MASSSPVSLATSNGGPHWAGMPESLLRDIHRSDQLMYPCPALTYDLFASWAAACPDLFLCLRRGREDESSAGAPVRLDSDAVHGVVIALPLRREYWVKLLAGEIEEHDVVPEEMFPPVAGPNGSVKTEVGLHIFHIERCPDFSTIWTKGSRFTDQALQQVSVTVAENHDSWKVIGFSALTATPQGKAAFQRAGFSRVSYKRLSPCRQSSMRLRRLAFRCLVLKRLALKRVGIDRSDLDPESGAPAEMMERWGNKAFLLPI